MSAPRLPSAHRVTAILAASVAAITVAAPGPAAAETAIGTKPNILVFLSDDMGWSQPGFNGGTEVATPSMDRIANEGVKLTQFYVQPVCSPTRAALLTGRYAWKNGTELRPTGLSSHGMLLDERTIAEALRDAGYVTWMVGKWHLGHWREEHLPLQRGFDHHYGLYGLEVDSFTHSLISRFGDSILDWHRNGRPVVESGYSTFLLAEEAVQLIERHDGSRPFFLYLPFNAPHVPHQAPTEFLERFQHLQYGDQRAQVEAMDVAMGRVMDALDIKGILDDTLIMFLNDNGGTRKAGSNRPYRSTKGRYYEGGIRVPAVIRWPGRIPPRSQTDALLHVVDLFPTFARLAGADTSAGLPLDGLDAWDAIAAGAASPRNEVVHALDVIRVGDWKLIEKRASFYNDPPQVLQLFNIREDPYETTNLAARESARVAELRARLAYHQQFARDGEGFKSLPGFPPIVFGAEEHAKFGWEVRSALRQREAGNSGPDLLRLEVAGATITLVYGVPLDANSVPPASAFRVVVNPGYQAADVTDVEVQGSKVVLTLAQAVGTGQTAGLTYELPPVRAIRDAVGILATGVTWVTARYVSAEGQSPLTARFEHAPALHDGSSPFKLRLRFSEPVSVSPFDLTHNAIRVAGGRVLQARRVAGLSWLWELTVIPSEARAVVLRLPARPSCTRIGALCSADGKALSNSPLVTVEADGTVRAELAASDRYKVGAASSAVVTTEDGATTRSYGDTVTRAGPPEATPAGFSLAPENGRPSGIWSDGETAWVADVADAKLYAYRRSDGERQPEKDIATRPAPTGVWSDGKTLWVAGLGGGLTAHQLSDGAWMASRDLRLEASTAPIGVWSDGETLWAAEWLGDTVQAYRLSDGRRTAARDIELADKNLLPVGVWSDRETLWVADWGERIFAYRLADGERMPELELSAGSNDEDPSGLWSGNGTLLTTSWEGRDVRARPLPEAAPRSMHASQLNGLGGQAGSVSPIADRALLAAIEAALGKAAGESVSAAELRRLEALEARNAGIRELAGLEGATGLNELDLGFNPVADLRPLRSLPGLESLNLDGTAPDLQQLASLAGLKRLSLRNTGIDELQPLASLAGLTELDVGDNRIADLSPLTGLLGLMALRADRNRIADLWPLARLAGLETLELGANRILDLNPLAGLTRLRVLRLEGNGLKELYPLAGLGALRALNLAGNAVESVGALANLDGLRRLDLRGNPVEDLRPLSALPYLAWVHVGGSRIKDLAPLDNLSGLTVAGRDDRDSPSIASEDDARASRQGPAVGQSMARSRGIPRRGRQ